MHRRPPSHVEGRALFSFLGVRLAASIPNYEPSSFSAGMTVRWTRLLPDYSYSDGWRLKYAFRGIGKLDVVANADADGAGHAINISAADSQKLAAGQYRWQAWVELSASGEIYPVGAGSTRVDPNFQAANAGDLQLTTEKEIAQCDAAIAGLLAGTNKMYEIGGRRFEKRDLDELYRTRGILYARLARENGGQLRSYAMRFCAPR